MASSLTVDERNAALMRGRRLEYFTVCWNTIEAAVSIFAGALAGSIALVGFGLDSIIETASGSALIWRLHHSNDAIANRERSERVATRIVGVCFFLLSIYITVESLESLLHREAAAHSPLGIAIAVASLIVMPLLARSKRKAAAKLQSAALLADSRQTDLCAYLSVILLAGLALNSWLGWWWADSVAGLIMVPIIVREGIDGWRGKGCECHAPLCASNECSQVEETRS